MPATVRISPNRSSGYYVLAKRFLDRPCLGVGETSQGWFRAGHPLSRGASAQARGLLLAAAPGLGDVVVQADPLAAAQVEQREQHDEIRYAQHHAVVQDDDVAELG